LNQTLAFHNGTRFASVRGERIAAANRGAFNPLTKAFPYAAVRSFTATGGGDRPQKHHENVTFPAAAIQALFTARFGTCRHPETLLLSSFEM
jgi:hypothetical protein